MKSKLSVFAALLSVFTVVIFIFGPRGSATAEPTTAPTVSLPLVTINPDCQPKPECILDQLDITLPPQATKTKTVTVPVPRLTTKTRTVTLRPDRVVKTRTIRPPQETVFVAGPTRTIATAGPTRTVVSTDVVTRRIVSEVTTTKTGQTVTRSVTIAPENGSTGTPPDINFPDFPVLDFGSPQKAALSTLGLISFFALAVLALWLGYILGFKDKERSERSFLSALRDLTRTD